jgi:hypothetical protein
MTSAPSRLATNPRSHSHLAEDGVRASGVLQLPDNARANARSAVSQASSRDRRAVRVRAQHQRARRGIRWRGTLPHGRQAFFRIERRRDSARETQPLQPGCREDDRVVLPGVELAQPRVDVAAQRQHLKQRVALAELRLAAQTRRTDAGTAGSPARSR